MWTQLASGRAVACKRSIDLDHQCLKDKQRREASNTSSIYYLNQSWCTAMAGNEGHSPRTRTLVRLAAFGSLMSSDQSTDPELQHAPRNHRVENNVWLIDHGKKGLQVRWVGQIETARQGIKSCPDCWVRRLSTEHNLYFCIETGK